MNKLAKKLSSVLGSSPGSAPRQNRRRRQRRAPRRRIFRRGMRLARYPVRTLPSAYVRTPVAKFSTKGVENGVIVTGCDLVYDIPETIEASNSKVFAVISANPLYWLGTRIAGLANMYQNYRPLSFSVHYVPQVAVTQPGTVFMGTLWESASSETDLQQTLLTSNGGLATPCYSPASSNVRLRSNLSMNLYRLHETGTYDSVPFYFIAGVAGAEVVPGYFFVTYRYVFKNAMGSSWVANSRKLALGQLPVRTIDAASSSSEQIIPYVNSSVVTLQDTSDDLGRSVPAGSVFALERDTAGGMVLKQNGSDRILPGDTQVMLYGTQPVSQSVTSSVSLASRAVVMAGVLSSAESVSGGEGLTGPVLTGTPTRMVWDGFRAPSLATIAPNSKVYYGRVPIPEVQTGYDRLVYLDVDISSFGASPTVMLITSLMAGSRFTTGTELSPSLLQDSLVQIVSRPSTNYRATLRLNPQQRSVSWMLIAAPGAVYTAASPTSDVSPDEYQTSAIPYADVIPFGDRPSTPFIMNPTSIPCTNVTTGQIEAVVTSQVLSTNVLMPPSQ